MALASASVNPFERTLRGLPSLMLTPSAGFAAIFPFATAQPKIVLRPDRSLSLTVFAEIGRPVRGLVDARR